MAQLQPYTHSTSRERRTQMEYTENAPKFPLLSIGLLVVVAALISVGLWMLLGTDKLGAGLGIVAVGAFLTLLLGIFRVLRTEVDDERLRARYGPFRFTVAGDAIEEARVTPYRWLLYGGWGIRWTRQDGRTARAVAVPFLRTGVTVDAQPNRRYYLTSRHPEDLAAAVNRLAEGCRRRGP